MGKKSPWIFFKTNLLYPEILTSAVSIVPGNNSILFLGSADELEKAVESLKKRWKDSRGPSQNLRALREYFIHYSESIIVC